MCHGAPISAFPEAKLGAPFGAQVHGYSYGDVGDKRIAILPDIYGCNPFYQGMAAHFLNKGARVDLIDPFHGLGELPEITREAAFARRNKVQDKTFLDAFGAYVSEAGVTGVIGFCLGGLYIFELARRGLPVGLVGLYGFPQGLPNDDPIDPPFTYLSSIKQPFVMLMGRDDEPVGRDNIDKLEATASSAPAMSLTVYEGVGHNFLPLLDSDAPEKRALAEDAMRQCEETLL
ncbi:MAG: dienelactone hydrolase family protein [Pseudomonadota bacterium]